MIRSLTRSRTVESVATKERYERLVKESHRQAYGLAYRLCGNATEAEDLLQDAYVRAYRFFDRYDPEMPFARWLFRIITNAYIDSVRRRGKIRVTSLERFSSDGSNTMDLVDEQSSPDRSMFEGALDEHIQTGLNSIPAEFRMAVLLADVEGMAYEEIADVMGTSIGTVRSRLHRGRQRLRNFLVKSDPKRFGDYANEL